jgi:hypothetical protein
LIELTLLILGVRIWECVSVESGRESNALAMADFIPLSTTSLNAIHVDGFVKPGADEKRHHHRYCVFVRRAMKIIATWVQICHGY